MNTWELDIDKTHAPKDFIEALRAKGLKKGDGLILRSAHHLNSFSAISVLIMVAAVFASIFRVSDDAADQSSDDLLPDVWQKSLNKNITPEKLEKEIEKEYGINVELVESAVKRYDPLEEGFGILREDEVSLEKVRKKAWHRKK